MRIDNPNITGSFTLGAVTLPDGNAIATTGSNTYSGNQIINGNLIVTGSLTAQQYIISSSVTYLTESFASGSHKFGDSSDDYHDFTGSLRVSGSLNINGGTIYTTASYIGIGRTAPEFVLDVNGDIALNRTNKLMFAGPTAGDRSRSYIIGDGNNNLFVYGPSSNVITTFGYTGNFIVGTTGDTGNGTKLQVSGSMETAGVVIGGNVASGIHKGQIYTDSNNALNIYAYDAGGIIFRSNGGGTSPTEQMRLQPNGYLGIGTTNPQAKLSLVGGSTLRFGNDGDSGNNLIYLRGGTIGDKAIITLNHYGYADYSISAGSTTNGVLSITKTAGGTDGISINSSGQVSVGSTDFGYGLLTVMTTNNTVIGSTEWGSSSGGALSSAVYNLSQTVGTGAGIKLVTRNSGASVWGMYNISTGTNSGDLVFGSGTGGSGAERIRFSNGGGYNISYTEIGNISSGALSSFNGSQYNRYHFTSPCDNTFRTLVSSINQRHIVIKISGSDAGTFNYGEYYFTMSFPGYGVSNSGTIYHTTGGWNTGDFTLQYTNTANDYYLQFKCSSYYNSSNNASYYMEVFQY